MGGYLLEDIPHIIADAARGAITVVVQGSSGLRSTLQPGRQVWIYSGADTTASLVLGILGGAFLMCCWHTLYSPDQP